jgi:hypothetical protein
MQGYTYRHRLTDGFTKCVVEMSLGFMIHIPSFIEIGSGIQKFTDIQTAWRQHKPTFGK